MKKRTTYFTEIIARAIKNNASFMKAFVFFLVMVILLNYSVSATVLATGTDIQNIFYNSAQERREILRLHIEALGKNNPYVRNATCTVGCGLGFIMKFLRNKKACTEIFNKTAKWNGKCGMPVYWPLNAYAIIFSRKDGVSETTSIWALP